MTDGALELSNGRRVGWCEWGDRDAPAVVYFHGMPGSRLEVLLARPSLERCRPSVRLIGLDRPGYGRSSPASHSGYLGWGATVGEALRRLGVDRFAVLGFSGGAPWALAAATELGDRITRVGLIGGLAPPDTPAMAGTSALAPDLRPTVRQALGFASMTVRSRVGLADRIVRESRRGLCAADLAAVSEPDAAALAGWILRDGYANWGRAFAYERILARQPWGFDLGRVGQPVHLWHGEQDTVVPATVSSEFGERLRHSACTIWPDHGHLSWLPSDRFPEALLTLVEAPA
jgi:pimeloyl-ACP methyl ester carboxylesterase